MITITLVDNGTKRYAMVTTGTILGRMYDNNAETITVVKPASEVGRTCTMIVTAASSGCFAAKTIDEIEVGNDPVSISNALSQYTEVKIGFSFSDDTGYVKNSEVQTFKFLEAQKPDNWQPDDSEIEYKVEQVIKKGFIKVGWSETSPNTLVFKNLAGEVVDEIELSPFVQEQSNLAETDNTSETFVRNKSTKYLENEGDPNPTISGDTSKYATENYVETYGGKIDKIKVNDVEQTITDKTVNITVPTKTSDLNNDSGFITKDVNNLTNYTDTTTLNNTLNKVVQSDTGVTVSGDNVSLSKSFVNVGTGATSSSTTSIPLATDETGGLMSSSDYAQIRDNAQRIENLEGKTTRLLYSNTVTTADITVSDTTTLQIGSILKEGSIVNGSTLLEDTTLIVATSLATDDLIVTGSTIVNGSVINGVSYPTATQINTFVTALGYTSPFEGIAVVTNTTYHIWHYYENNGIGWKDDGVDTVSTFTNSYAGVIQGSATDGKVYAETDGTGSVYGWDTLKNRVTDLENNKQDALVSGTNIKTINSTSVLGSGNIDTKELFYCTYDTTTYAEITTALSNGKLPICIYNDRVYYLASSVSSAYRFSSEQSDYVRYVTVNDSDVWSTSAYNFELASNKVTSISNTSTDTQFPSAKCVYDNLALKQNIPTYETYTISSWTALSGNDPYTYSATVTATYTIGANTLVELINDQAVLFGTYGFAIGEISGQNITIYSIGEPSANVTLKIGYGG